MILASKYKFCPLCAGRLAKKLLHHEQKNRLVCQKCGFIFYDNPHPTVGVLIIDKQGRILLGQKTDGP